MYYEKCYANKCENAKKCVCSCVSSLALRWVLLDDQTLCTQATSSFVYGAVPIGASIYVVGELDTGKLIRTSNRTLSFIQISSNSVLEKVKKKVS